MLARRAPGFIANNRRLEIRPDEMTERAERETGLSDWGGFEFREPFEVLARAMREGSNLNWRGRLVLNQHYARLLTNLLRLADDWKRHPETGAIPVTRPLFIVGFPRTGTTLLHNLLALDGNSRALRYWELLFPSPGDGPPRARRRRARQFVFGIEALSPKLRAIHKLEPDGPEECCHIFDHLFLDKLNHALFDAPSYNEYFDAHDPRPSYRFHKRMLQWYSRDCEFTQFALKSPRHLFGLEALLETHPDARLIWTHRDPLEAVPSLCGLMETGARIVRPDVNLRALGRACLEYAVRAFERGWPVRGAARNLIDVEYRDLVRDPVGVLRSIYQAFGMPFGDGLEGRVRSWLAANPAGRHGVHRYGLERYGLEAGDIRSRLGPYLEACGGL